jgi:hypothetical protein
MSALQKLMVRWLARNVIKQITLTRGKIAKVKLRPIKLIDKKLGLVAIG